MTRVARILERVLGIPAGATPLPAPLDMLIATILSQNTNDKNSHRAYTTLRERFPTWEGVAGAPMRSIRSAIRTGGMANQKSGRIQQTLEKIRSRYGAYDLSPLADLSNDKVFEALLDIDGVGVKTASCVLLFSLGREVFPVDTHIHRICGRLGLASGCRTPEQTFAAVKELIPKGRAYTLHTNMIRFGRRICRAVHPVCGECPLFADCVYPEKRRERTIRTNAPPTDHDFMLLDNVR